MKTSNKLLFAATLLIFGYLVIYNFQLRAEYKKGEYKSRFYGMRNTALNSFTAVENKAGNFISIRIEKDPKFGIWVDQDIKNKVIITLHNNTLYVDYKDKSRFNGFLSGIIITCPTIKSITTTPITIPEMRFLNTETTTISGFDQDAMSINVNKGSEIELTKNTLNKLTAGTSSSDAAIIVQKDNSIKAADFNIIGKSQLKLFSSINHSNYNYTDSATVMLNGKSFQQLIKPNKN